MGRGAIRVFGFPDIHWSQRDERALSIAEAAHRYFQPDITVVGGDLLDCGPFSRFPTSTMAEALSGSWVEEELDPACRWLDKIQQRTKQTTIFLEGNHEARVEKVCASGGRALQAMYPLVSPRLNIQRGRKRFVYVPWNTDGCTVGPGAGKYDLSPNLTVVHGWFTSKYPARKHLDTSRTQSVIFHHTHRVDSVTLKNPWDNTLLTGTGTGCLCKLMPLYAHGGKPTEWCHAFWVAFISRRNPLWNTHYTVEIGPYGAVMPDGKEIK